MSAVALKFKSYDRVSAKSRPVSNKKNKSKSTEKVIDLFAPQGESRDNLLSAQDREELVLTYRMKARKLARSILRKWHARLDLQEVDSVVDLSLCEAVKNYNPSKGASFMTFLFYHLRGNLIRTVSTAATQNLVPCSEFEAQNGMTEDGDRGLANAMEVADALSNRENVLPDEALYRKEMIKLSKQACSSLAEIEKFIIEKIYIQEAQLRDIAVSLGYSRCHVSRLRKKALESLHKDMIKRMAIAEENNRKARKSVVRIATCRKRVRRNVARAHRLQSVQTKIAVGA
jgi:RNA polymerase sigma factor for flagellar operon FliA